MAITRSTPPTNNSQKVKKRVVASIWLIMALLTAAAALALWMFSAAPSIESKAASEEGETPEAVTSNISQISQIDEMHELDSEVKPISFDTLVRDLRDYPPEFKDVRYLKKNKGKWTVQVMDVSEHDIITDYLSSRDDRKKFAYFRYRDENNQPRYLLTYDVLASPQMAKGVASTTNFELPSNVRVIPEEIDAYVDVIEQYELTGPIKDLSANRTRQVKLQPTKREIEARRRQSNADKEQQQTQQSDTPNNSDNEVTQSQSAEIKRSNDTSDTLSVQEERKVIVDGEAVNTPSNAQSSNQTDNNPKNNKPTGSNNNSAGSKPVEPTKPIEPTKPQQSTPQKPDNKQEADSIRQLIEEKTS